MGTDADARDALVDRKRIHDRLVELIRIPSAGGEEEACVARVAEWLSDAGAEVDLWHDDAAALQFLPHYPGHEFTRATIPVVAARLRGSRPGPAILLSAHVDVVPPGDLSHWNYDPYSGWTEGDRVYGRGSADMKAGLVGALEVLQVFAEGPRDFPGQIIVVAVPGEEDGGVGTFSAIKRGWRGDAAIVPEPTVIAGKPTIVTAHAGCMILKLHVHGKSGHASNRLSGENALDHYIRLHQAMREDERMLNERENDPLMRAYPLPYATNVGIVHGGDFSSSVMGSLEADIRIGIALDETVEEAEARFRRAIAQAAEQDAWLRENPPDVTVVTRGFGSGRIPQEHPLVAAVSNASEKVFGGPPVVRAAPYACDMSGWVRLADTPTILYGPGDIEMAHAADEWVSLEETVGIARALTRATGSLLETQLPDQHGGHAVVPDSSPYGSSSFPPSH